MDHRKVLTFSAGFFRFGGFGWVFFFYGLSNFLHTCFLNLILFYLFILLLAALGLRCCARAFSSCSELGLLFVEVHGLLIAVASLVAEHGF